MKDERTYPLSWKCPSPQCKSKLAESYYTKSDLEKALEAGEIFASHIDCDCHWKQKIGPQENKRIKEVLDNFFS
jgi:hypothetical protein